MNKKLQQKLLNVSNFDPCINLKNKSSSMIDLFNFVDSNELFEFLWSRNEKLELRNTDFDEIEFKLNSFNEPDKFINFCINEGFELTKTLINQLNKNFKLNKSKAINYIFKKSVTITKIFKKIQNEANLIQREENIYPLYVASCFISGKDVDQNPVNAPLLLWEVSIEIKDNVVYLVKNNSDVTNNEKIIFYLNYIYGLKINEDKITEPKDLRIYEKLLKRIVNIDLNQKFEKFQDCKGTSLTFHNYCCLAFLEPLGGVIKNDVEAILKKNEEPFAINNKIIDYKKIEDSVIKEPYNILEINRCLNLFQKFAIKSSLERNTLIYGPPGTGKSETIASLIANIIYREKSVLMVSEKMAALDVLEKRLNKLSSISLFAFKQEHKDKFYDALINIDRNLKSNLEFDQKEITTNIKRIKKSYEEIVDYFNNINVVANKLENEYLINKFLDSIPAIEEVELNDETRRWYESLFKYWPNKSTLIDCYSKIKKINSLISGRTDAVEILEKYHFKANVSEIKDFLEYFNNNQHKSWLLKNFIKSKKDYQKAPLIKSQLKGDIVILKLLEDIANSDLQSIDFNDIEFLQKIPKAIDCELAFQQLLVYYLVAMAYENKSIDKKISFDNLIDKYKTIRNEIAAKNDVLITNQYLTFIKNKISKNEKLAKAVNEVISYAFLKKRPNINAIIRKHYDTLRFLFPIWILSPTQTCVLTPCKKGIFDYGIFDEASQMFLERAFPLVYRCQINIVAGDDKQLQPTSFFMKNIDNESEDELTTLNQGNSLFEQANLSMWAKFYLKNHYRSDASELIAFSNKYIYDNQLEFDTKNIHLSKPLEVFDVNGVWKYQTNIVEIEKILEIIQQKEYDNKSILIITFNQQQAKFLENEINNELATTKIFKKYLDQTLKIRSLENVQGDEADVVILSIAFAKENNNLRNFFGPISQAGGLNRLNVAITRAKEKMIVVKSIKSSDIKISDNENNNIFKYFLNYVENQNIDSLLNVSKKSDSLELFINDVYDNLKVILDKNKFDIKKSLIIGKDDLDIAIISKQKKIVSLGLILDNINPEETINDFNVKINQQYFLIDLKYNIYRINIFEWKLNKNAIINKIIKLLGIE